jgi:lipopolysaccharide biosynthesis glycosyltransferase
MEIAFCADRNMLAALHVSATFVLCTASRKIDFLILGEGISVADLDLLRESLNQTGKEFTLRFHTVEPCRFKACPKLAGGLANYYRLLVPDFSDSRRIIYMDCDTLCLAKIEDLEEWNLDTAPIGMCAESPLAGCQDTKTAKLLGGGSGCAYFNSGFIIFDTRAWRDGGYTAKCLDFAEKSQPDYHEQSALNVVLHRRIAEVPARFNFHTNVRANWPFLKRPDRGQGCLLHFVDYPKPWSAGGRWVHPFGNIWWDEYRKTAHFKKNRLRPPAPRWDAKTRFGYRKALKDKILFTLYERGAILPKGVPSA